MKRLHILIIFFLLIGVSNASAQKRKLSKAYSTYEAGEYSEAVDYFKDAYSKSKRSDPSRGEYIYMIADCYRRINDSRSAETWYKLAVRQSDKPEAQYYLATTYKKNGKYAEAIEALKEYKKIAPADARADQELLACELALEWQNDPEAYNVEEIKDLNLTQYSDFSPIYAREDYGLIYFTSSRDDALGNKTNGATGQGFTDIFESRLDKKSKWSTPVPVDVINSEFDDGTPSITIDFKDLYFTRCEVSKREKKGCAIMHSSRSNGKWSTPSNLNLVADSLIAAHPAISPDGNTLYFVSDLKGGYGGKDLWYVTKEGSSWSSPKNMGPDINTPADEVFPFMREDGTLYYSTEGFPGMGGLDIFKAVAQPNGTWVVENMKAPINSSADDFGISFEGNSEKGIFSSTRKGRQSDNLYAFELPPLKFSITGLIKDEETGAPIDDATVQLIASDGSNMQTTSNNGGEFSFSLKQDVDYIFLASKKGYLNGKEREST